MRILIAPDMADTVTGAPRYLAVNLADLLLNEGHAVTLSACSSFSYARAEKHRTPAPFHHPLAGIPHTKEESMYLSGTLDSFYLKKDLSSLQNAIQASHAQLVLEINRPAAVIAARLSHIPVWSFLHPCIYRRRSFPDRYLRPLNALLRENHLEQILRISDLYSHVSRRFVFGPVSISPLPSNGQAERLGSMSLPSLEVPAVDHICVYLSDNFHGKISDFTKILQESFQGADYEVDFWYPGIHSERKENIHYLPAERFNLISNARICIHDGDSAVFNACLSSGTRQLVINDGDEERSWNASAAERTGAGLSIPIDNLNMEQLYGAYRQILSNDFFLEHAQALKKEVQTLGSLSYLADQINAF